MKLVDAHLENKNDGKAVELLDGELAKGYPVADTGVLRQRLENLRSAI